MPNYDPRATQVTFYSPALGVRRSFFVYVPPTLGAGQHAPALYLLRGHEREWLNPAEDGSRGGVTAIDVYERLRAAGRVGPLVLVFPGTTSDDGRVPGLLTNMRAPELAGAPGVGTGRFEDFFFDDLLPYVDAHFPTLRDGRRRAIMGFSLGGVMAAKAAIRRPGSFACVGAYDGTFLYAADRGRRVRVRDRVLHNPMFDPVFGVPRDIPFVAANSPASMALRADPATLRRITWAVGYGPEEQEPWNANYYRGVYFAECLRARGVENAFAEGVLAGGDHSWRSADLFLARTLPIYDAALRLR
jgi:S-formylglutathione hydrolase FrmB